MNDIWPTRYRKPAIILVLSIILLAAPAGCQRANPAISLFPDHCVDTAKLSVDQSYKGTPQQLPSMMRLHFGDRWGWIRFEERTQGKVLANYSLEAPQQKITVPGEYGTVENPQANNPVDGSTFGVMELTKDGKSLKGIFKNETDTETCGELELDFSKNLQTFTGKWHKKDEKGWTENISGSTH